MTDDISEDVSVLIVDDEENLADMYASYLPDVEETEVAYGGQAGIEALDNGHDVVLLDRLMPVVSGDEVLAHIDTEGIDCRVALVTAVDPDFDIVNLSIDDYLVKPVSRDEIRGAVRRLAKLDTYDERMQTLTSKKSKRNALKTKKTREELAASDEFAQLEAEIEGLEQQIESIADDIDVGDVEDRI